MHFLNPALDGELMAELRDTGVLAPDLIDRIEAAMGRPECGTLNDFLLAGADLIPEKPWLSWLIRRHGCHRFGRVAWHDEAGAWVRGGPGSMEICLFGAGRPIAPWWPSSVPTAGKPPPAGSRSRGSIGPRAPWARSGSFISGGARSPHAPARHSQGLRPHGGFGLRGNDRGDRSRLRRGPGKRPAHRGGFCLAGGGIEASGALAAARRGT
jgi:hypothetical protein